MADQSHHVRIVLRYVKALRPQFDALGEKFRNELGSGYDGWGSDNTVYEYFLYGSNAQAMFDRIKPLIDAALRPGGHALLRAGPAGDKTAVETKIML